MPKPVAYCLLGTISSHSILDQNFRGKNPRERESTAGSGLVLGLMQSITVPYLGSYKVVGEVVEFNWWRTENQRFRKLENLIPVPEIPVLL